MVKAALTAGAILMVAGIAAGAWPAESLTPGIRRLIPTRTYARRGPTVLLHGDLNRVRTSSKETLSVFTLLSMDGYWVRGRPGYLAREQLRGVKVLVVDRDWKSVGDGRTVTMLSRWIHGGGSVLVLARGEGPEARHTLGAGRVAVIDVAAFETKAFVERLLDAVHWLDDPFTSDQQSSATPPAPDPHRRP